MHYIVHLLKYSTTKGPGILMNIMRWRIPIPMNIMRRHIPIPINTMHRLIPIPMNGDEPDASVFIGVMNEMLPMSVK